LAAPDYCIRGALQKSAGARTASSSRRTTAAGARPIGKQQRAPRRHGACPASSAASLSRTTRRLEQSSAPATPRCRSRPEGEAPLRRDRWLHEFCNQRPQPRRPTRPRLPVRPGDAALWRRRPDGPSYTVSHELLSSKHKSSSLAGIARTAGPGQQRSREREALTVPPPRYRQDSSKARGESRKIAQMHVPARELGFRWKRRIHLAFPPAPEPLTARRRDMELVAVTARPSGPAGSSRRATSNWRLMPNSDAQSPWRPQMALCTGTSICLINSRDFFQSVHTYIHTCMA
jgi:hypothetical protein